MKWDEFKDLLIGIGPETPLGRVVAIRAEDDKEMLKQFTPEQHRIRSNWRERRAERMSEAQMNAELEMIQKAFLALAE